MGEAVLAGLLDAGWAKPDELAVVEVLAPRRAELAQRYAGVHISETMVEADGALIAVKPYDVAGAVRAAVEGGARRVVSIAAGVTLATLEQAAGPGVAVVRAMPNTPALVRTGAAAISGGREATDDDLAWAEQILSAVGTVVTVPESQLDAVTGLSGSGPMYVFQIIEGLSDAGVRVGLSRDVAAALTVQTVLGAAKMAEVLKIHPAVMKDMVTSPGGTAIAALHSLERNRLRAILMDAVEAATARSKELGRGGA